MSGTPVTSSADDSAGVAWAADRDSNRPCRRETFTQCGARVLVTIAAGNLHTLCCVQVDYNHDGTLDHGSSLNGCDTFILDSATPPQTLSPKFTWHGFQYVVVTPSPGVHFNAELGALTAHWTTADLSDSATISFGGGGSGAETLSSINQIVKNSQISNVAAFMPSEYRLSGSLSLTNTQFTFVYDVLLVM